MGYRAAVSTSSDYEKFFTIEGKRYSHIIDPRTGYPVKGIVSVTIATDNATRADALSTGVFVLGLEKGMDLIEQLPDVEGIIIYEVLTPNCPPKPPAECRLFSKTTPKAPKKRSSQT
jgi:thiamine biosynthesis lipoprotein ApbE